MRLLVATGNRAKLAELREGLQGLPFAPVGLADLPERPPPVVEDGATFLENARKKALTIARATGLLTLADDSGLEVDALGGRPGVHSARFAGVPADDAANNARLLAELAGVPPSRRGARFVCVLVVASPEEVLIEVEGICPGSIAEAPRGTSGFGYDPLFLVPELGRTFAELGPEAKARLSHRARALARLRHELARLPAFRSRP